MFGQIWSESARWLRQQERKHVIKCSQVAQVLKKLAFTWQHKRVARTLVCKETVLNSNFCNFNQKIIRFSHDSHPSAALNEHLGLRVQVSPTYIAFHWYSNTGDTCKHIQPYQPAHSWLCWRPSQAVTGTARARASTRALCCSADCCSGDQCRSCPFQAARLNARPGLLVLCIYNVYITVYKIKQFCTIPCQIYSIFVKFIMIYIWVHIWND